MNRILIRRGSVVTYFFEAYETVRITEADVLIEDGWITKIGKDLNVDAVIIDAAGKTVLPGFINSDSRSFAAVLCRGIIEGHNLAASSVTVQSSLDQLVQIGIGLLSKEEIVSCYQTAMMEMVNGGVTTVLEQCPPALCESFIEAAGKNGLRAGLAVAACQTGKRSGKKYKEILSDLTDSVQGREKNGQATSGQIEVWLADSIGNIKNLQNLDGLLSIKPGLGLRLVIDIQNPACGGPKKRFSEHAIDFLSANGLLSPEVVLTGCSESHSKLEETGVHVVHSARAAAEDGIMIPYFPRYSAIPNVSVGTRHCSNDLLAELKAIAILGKVGKKGLAATKATDLFFGATVGGAKALGRKDIGRICEGYRGDLFIVNNGNPSLRPMIFPLINYIYHGTHADIDTVIIGGKILKQKGKLVGIEVQDVAEKAERAILKCWRHARKIGVL